MSKRPPKARPAPTTRTELGQRIRRRREALGLTRPELAARLLALGHSVRPQQIYRWEERGAEPGGIAIGVLERALDAHTGLSQANHVTEEGALTSSQLMALLRRLHATEREQLALQRSLASREAASERVTESFVAGFLEGFRESGAREAALGSAVTAQAQHAMRAEGRRPIAERKRARRRAS